MSNDERSIQTDQVSLPRINAPSRLITRGLVRLAGRERQFVELSTPRGAESETRAINNRGVAVGFAKWPGPQYAAVAWFNQDLVLLETRVGWQSIASDINDDGLIVGDEFQLIPTDETIEGEMVWEGRHPAVLWDDGRRFELEIVDGANSRANAVNNRGQIVGAADAVIRRPGTEVEPDEEGGQWEERAVLWEGRRGVFLPPPGGDWEYGNQEQAEGINSYGDIVGSCHGGAARWRNGVGESLDYSHADHYANYSGADAINDRGEVVGTMWDPGGMWWDNGYSAYVLWHDGLVTNLGPKIGGGKSGLGINNRGQIAGLNYTTSTTAQARLWDNGHVVDLWTPIGQEGYSVEVNDLGHVVGSYQAREATWRACMWR